MEQGSLDDAYPINHQDLATFNVGGVERALPDELQLEQLVSYLDATYDRGAAQYLALLPDRITHAAMLMLGSAVDHTMPGVAFPGEVAVEDCELGQIFAGSGSDTAGAWAVSVYDGPASARDNAWRPEVAGAAELAGVTIVDVDDPARAAEAVAFARERGTASVTVWAFGAAAPPAPADAYVLTYPTARPAAATAPTLIQVATRDEVALGGVDKHASPNTTVKRYHSTHYIATPAEARRRVRDVAEFLATSRSARG